MSVIVTSKDSPSSGAQGATADGVSGSWKPGLSLSSTKRAVLGCIVIILIITVLEFPPPIGFETRPQTDVSPVWLVFFLVILIVELSTIPLVFKKPLLGGWFGIAAAALNIIQVIADLTHQMQPEVAPLGYALLELMVVAVSLVLVYFSWMVLKNARMT